MAQRSVTPVQAATAFAVVGSVLFSVIPPFVRNLHASRLVEPLDGLNHIATRATALAAVRAAEVAYPPTVELTPREVPRGEPVTDPEGTWDNPTWRLLSFGWTVPHCYSFAFESNNRKGFAEFRASAHGDLDGDGVQSSFEVSGYSRDGAEPVSLPMRITREVE
jgi:hypothetical protein